MEVLLSQVTKQAMNYAIKTGITITSGYAIRQCGRLLKTVEGHEKEELAALQLRLESKIRIISPAIDMIELIAARGNTSLESAVTLTKSLRWDIQSLGVRLAKAVGEERLSRTGSSKASSRAQNALELKMIIKDIKNLLDRIEDAVPLISLAITTSGVNLSTTLPTAVSPSRLLQASTFLTHGDGQYSTSLPRAQQIGPTFTLSMYMLFAGHAYRPHDDGGIRETTWKEVMHKARVKLLRVPLDRVYEYPSAFEGHHAHADGGQYNHIPAKAMLHEFAYQLLVVEDLDDDRVHTFEDGEAQPGQYEGVEQAGVREIIPIHEISKIFYADTGKILNIGTDGETNNPILLLKRDINAVPPRRMMERSAVEPQYDSDDSHTVGGSDAEDDQSELDAQLRRESVANVRDETLQEEEAQPHPWRLPPNLDLEWMAFEVYTEEPSSDDGFDDESELDLKSPRLQPLRAPLTATSRLPPPSLAAGLSHLNLRPSTPSTPSTPTSLRPSQETQLIPSPQKSFPPIPVYTPKPPTTLPAIKTSLSLLEMLIRLTALQQFQQSSHLTIPDELLTFFLSESSTVGAGNDSELRRQQRREARLRVGFDPYDESPIKRRGEEYLEHEFHEDEQNLYAHDGGYGNLNLSLGARTPASYDYDSFPHGKATNTNSSPFPNSSPSILLRDRDIPLPSRESSSAAGRPTPNTNSTSVSASPLLRRATTQPGGQNRGLGLGLGIKQPSFRGPPTAPPTSSSPRVGGGGQQGQQERQQQQQQSRSGLAPADQGLAGGKGTQGLDTPPSSTGKRG
ncbi:RanGTP-binding protein-domain-containing protein [Clohesyomyces aquaticus]|uniref:RanGTP-binding protein-domain-containing protein n=1 Tax=Clohesyomyces aquaticus TaxID=1231657 RepID=A0A1Y1YQ96_9PLEO|nr:RanGTP-binding protein-domain-containing protein [Clohesyomyces aquaticus]